MAIEYSFYMSTSTPPELLMRTLLMSNGVPWNPGDGCVVDAPHFRVTVSPVSRESREIRGEGFGFYPDVYFTFRTWGDDSVKGKPEIVHGTLAICQAFTGDAIMLFNWEIVLFLRKAGTLYVNSAYWRGDYSLFTPPYELKDFPVL